MQEQNSKDTTAIASDEIKVQAKNFAELRSIAENAKREAAMATNENLKLKQHLEQLKEEISKPKESMREDQDNDPYIDQARLQRELEKFKAETRKDIDKIAEEKARILLNEERKADYLKSNADFNDIMQEETLSKFISAQPRIAEIMKKMPDTFERQQLVYETIKMMKSMTPEKSTSAPISQSPLQAAFAERNPRMAYQAGGNSGGPFASMGDFSQGGMKNAYDKYKALQKTASLG